MLLKYKFLNTVAGEDFNVASLESTFSVGTSLPASRCVTLNTVQDSDVVGDQDFVVDIGSINPSSVASPVSPSQQTLVITDNDGN